MFRSNPLLWPKPPAIWSYGIAVLLVTTALILTQWPTMRLGSAPVSLFLLAVMFSAWLGGVAPGLLATVLSALAFYYYFLPPLHSFTAKPAGIPRLISLAVSLLLVGLLSAAQRTTTESLRRSESYLAEAQRLTHTGSWVWRVAGGDASHLSEEWYRIYSFDPEEGMPAWEERLQRVHPEDRAKWQETISRAIAEKLDYEMEFRILLPDGTAKYVHTVGHPVVNASGELTEFVGSATDITERRRAEEALRQAQADLAHVSRVTTMGELTASLAHEVKQPITAASTNATTCLRWLAGDTPNIEEARAAAKRIVEDGKRAAEIISRIRRLFKKGPPELEAVDVNEVIREMTVMLRSEAMRYSISVRTELAPDLPQVMGDRVQLPQVLMNLMINGIEAMKEVDGTRELAIKSQQGDNDQVLVSVSDTGIGLPQQQAEQIFNAFFTTKPHGTGMGLRISRSILESHGGRLWAANNSSRGASFYLTLPAKGTRAAKAHK
jgi:signal transduction histidine kinase